MVPTAEVTNRIASWRVALTRHLWSSQMAATHFSAKAMQDVLPRAGLAVTWGGHN